MATLTTPTMHAPAEPSSSARPRGWQRPTIDSDRARMIAVLVAAGIVVLVSLHGLLGPYLHDQAQEHLTDEFLEAAPSVGPGQALGVVQAASVELNEVFVEGISDAYLRRAPGHHPASALPGSDGAAVIVGRRSQFGGSFEKIGALKPGDQIVIRLRGGGVPVGYAVSEVVTVSARDLDDTVSRAGDNSLALVTSGGGLLGGDRVVVLANLLGIGSPAGETSAVSFQDVRGPELFMWLVWAAAGTALVVFGRRTIVGRARAAAIVLLVPLGAFVVLRLWLATSALLPMTY